jgi:signal transduction histidine kinase
MNLAFAAALRERQMLAVLPTLTPTPYAADVILPRFGEFLLKSDYISESQLHAALQRQKQLVAEGNMQTVGQVLLNMGFVTREQLDQASIQQVKQLQEALLASNRQLEERVAQRTQELQQALRQLNEFNRLKTQFVSNISHELRTPLSHVKGYCELLRASSEPLTPNQREAADFIMQAAERLQRLIEDLLGFASAAQGKMLINATAFSLTEVVEAVLLSPHITELKRHVHLHAEVPPALPPILADAEKIKWAVTHLLDNAIKFTPVGGKVSVSVAQHNRFLKLSVSDTGIGIPAERLTEVFEPFQQLDGSVTRYYGGIGLGLALVKQIVEAHGSTVAVESEPGVGSTFSFELPIAMS